MALVNSSFTVNVTPGAMPPTVHVSEYDIGRTYAVTINGQNGSAFNIPTGTTATVEGTLNGVIGFTTDATISGSTVSFTLTESMTAKSGKAWCKIKLTLNDEPIQTCAFVLAVDRAGVEADTVIGANGFEQQIVDAVNDWLDEHPPAVGGMSEEFKQALLNCFANVAWINDDGQTYYDALYDAMYPPVDVLSISAVFTQGEAVIYETDSLDTLRQYLVVTATTTDSTTQTVTDYTLSGTLTEGTSTITVLYNGKTDTFAVTVTEYNPLPSGYTKYDYISADGNAYFQIQNASNPPVPLGYTVRTIAQQTTHSDSNAKVASGGGNNDAYIAYAAYSKTAGKAGAYYGAAASFTDVENLLTAPTEFITKFAVDGVTTTTTNSGVSQTVVTPSGGTTFKSSNYIRIGYSGSSSSSFVGKIYLVEVKNASDVLTHQFIPCKRDSDNKIGMYDTVTSTFYASSGSSQFTAGND